MSYLLDTDIISAFNKKTIPPRMAAWLVKNESNSFISLVSVAEMRHGLDAAPESHRAELTRRIEATEERFTESFVPLDLDVLIRWKQLLSELKSVNRTLTCEDSLLAATCLANGLVMATNNVRHFEPARRFGLKIENPLA
jgi:predicted nucleic acid-binding protein